tara:strand:- start:149 stop:1066 length:918 start_codon:yes stop_codon:yes gene_type:complete
MELKFATGFLFVMILIFFFISNSNIYDIIPRKNKTCDSQKMNHCFFSNIINIEKLTNPKIFIHIKDQNNILGLCQLCIESAIKYCSSKYDIILYTNDDISKLIDEEDNVLCNIENIGLLGGQDLKQWEEYCKFKILHKHGGIVMEPYFLFSSCPQYKDFVPKKLKVCHINNEGVSVSNKLVVPSSCYMMAAPKNDITTEIYVEYLERLCENNYTSDTKHFDKSFEKLYYLDNFSEELIGAVDINNKLIHLEDLLRDTPTKLVSDNYCLFINVDLLNKKRHHGWILNMSKEQILESKTFISKYAKM